MVGAGEHARCAGGLRFLVAFVVASVSTATRAQVDVVVVEDGGQLFGEVKSLDRGKLRFDTDATDTIDIDWAYVTSLTSSQNFIVRLSDGQQLFGTWVETEAESALRLNLGEAALDIPIETIVRMTPIEGRLIDRIDMSVDLGFSASKSTGVKQTDFSYDFNYRSEERLLSLNVDATRSRSTSESKSIRLNNMLSYRRFINDRTWDPNGYGTVERNDELGLDRRVTIGGGMSRWLADTNSKRVSFNGGLVVSRENETEALDSDSILEAQVGIDIDWFRYDAPELDLALRMQVFERLTGSGRTRGNLDLDLRWELVSDFFWGVSVYYTFNTEPTGVDTSSEDYGIVTSLGWSF